MKAAYTRFFARCGLKTISVEADTGVMGGSFSHEFMVPAEVGDDDVVYCEEGGYAANREKATSALVPADLVDAAPDGTVEEFPTPGVVTITALEAAPYGVPADRQFKTLVYVGDGKPFLVILRGCDELEEAKLGTLGFTLFRAATPEEIEPVMGAKPGSLGAVRGKFQKFASPDEEELKIKAAQKLGVNFGLKTLELAGVFADQAVRLIGNGVTGANRDGFHLRRVNVTRDLAITKFGDFRRVRAGEPCPKSGRPLQIRRAIEVGHVFKLGTKYSEKYGATYTDDQKQSKLMVMGCYGIGISRTLQAVIEQGHDADGIIWPWNVAPYQVLVVLLDPQLPEAFDLARKLAAAAEAAGADVLVDDRAERPGVKFKDADLIGVPLRITIGGRGLKEGVVEMKLRTEKAVEKVPLTEAEARVHATVAAAQTAAKA
jgi:prolyl-tRNA synthetase